MLTEDELENMEKTIVFSPEPGDIAMRLLAEVRELRLLLRDAVQDDTPGNRVWREGVKAGLEAATKVVEKYEPIDDWFYTQEGGSYREEESASSALNKVIPLVRAIDPATVLPGDCPAEGGNHGKEATKIVSS